MALQRPTYIGVDNIMKMYDSLNGDCQYYFSVWHSQKDIAFQYVGDDARKARSYLEENLQAMAESQNDNLLYIKFHPADKKGKYITKSTDVIACTPVCVVEPDDSTQSIAGTGTIERAGSSRGMTYEMWKSLEMLKTLPDTIDARIDATINRKLEEAALLEEEEPEIDPTERMIGMITGLAQNPQIMALVGQVMNFLKPAVMPQRVNGVVMEKEIEPAQEQQSVQEPINEELMNNALSRLHQHCRLDTDMSLLADMAENNPAQFKMLLGMLRAK